jgi:hypothetical protein
MFVVEVYAAVRQFVFNDGKSQREAARVFGLSRETVSKMCRFFVPPGYVRRRPAEKPKLGPLIREFGTWRSVLSGGASGSVTVGNGKFLEQRGATRS